MQDLAAHEDEEVAFHQCHAKCVEGPAANRSYCDAYTSYDLAEEVRPASRDPSRVDFDLPVNKKA